MRLLIAGGQGYIGSYLNSYYSDKISVTSIDYSSHKSQDNYYQLDLTKLLETEIFAKTHDHFDVLIFLVGLAHDKGKGKDLPVFREVNYQTIVNLLSALNSVGKTPGKIIFSSTISVYGERLSQTTYTEQSITNSFSPYAVTKHLAEQYLCANYSERSWLLRFAPVYSKSFLLNINRRIRLKKWLYKVGKGNAKLSLCNIDNIIIAIEGILKDRVPPDIYNISDPIDYTYNDLLMLSRETFTIRIPRTIIKLAYLIGLMTGNIFLKENSVKLGTDNIFPSDKISSFVNLNARLENTNFHDAI
jgi:nucleoside-diphosphate-sugar epimerase